MNNIEEKLKNAESLLLTKNFNNTSIKLILDQLKLFLIGTKIPKLIRPCIVNDGIVKIDENDQKELIDLYNQAALEGRLMKFVPASGAASRMFQKLHVTINVHGNPTLDDLKQKSDSDPHIPATIKFLSSINQFAFYDELKSLLDMDDGKIDSMINEKPFDLINAVVEKVGLEYAHKPKAAIKFHKYKDDTRTSFEEQVYESLHYLPDKYNNIKIHFTISEAHTDLFEKMINYVKSKLTNTDFRLEISYSYQKEHTNTIAVDMDDKIIFNEDNTLLLRQAGHGALLENLNELNGDIIFIKNIDNVCIEDFSFDTVLYKKLLSGYLVKIQRQIFDILNKLESDGIDPSSYDDAFTFINEKLGLATHIDNKIFSNNLKKTLIYEFLNRPIRVCGMVKNLGEPGGGPFWILEENDKISKQIVEQAQINKDDEKQVQIFNSSTHFNPVDIVCGVRDYRDNNFDLIKFRDDESGIITQKSKGGHTFKALELPGLWNGSMAKWITIFVEVPIITFNPVKEVNDLLRKEHQPLT